MNKILVSVIIPVYNVEQYIHNCVQSVLNQSYKDFEIILVDDGSPDRCPSICDEYAIKDSRIRVIHKSNGGLSSARNSALEIVKGDFVTFLDSDDFWHIDYLKILVELSNQTNADIVQCNFTRGDKTKFPTFRDAFNIAEFNNHTIFSSGNAKIIMCGKIYRRSLWEGIKMPTGKINEDDFTTWKLYYKARVIVITAQKLYYYTTNPNSIMSNQKKKIKLDFIEAYEERIQFFHEQKEVDLLDYTKIHFCKSLLMLSSNTNLTIDQKEILFKNFTANWSDIKHSKYLSLKLKIVFCLFNIIPVAISKFIIFIKS